MALTANPETGSRLRALGTFAGAAGAVVFGTSVVFSLAFPGASSWLTLGPIAASLAALAFWLSVAYRRLKERLSQRSGVFVFVTTGSALALLALLGGLNWMVAKSALSIDLTARGVHSLSEQTRKVLDRLDTDVRITAFYERGSAELMKLDSLVQGYQRHSGRLSFRALSPTRDVELTDRYRVHEGGPRVFVETRWDDKERAKTARFAMDLRVLNHEQELTNALMKAVQDKRPRVYMLTGHNEASADDKGPEGYQQSIDALLAEGYDVLRLNLLEARRVPDDAAAVLIAGPRQGLLPPEVSELSRYLVTGGSVAVLLEAGAPHGMGALLQSFGVQANDDIVIDLSPFGTMFGGGPHTAIATDLADHPITTPLAGSNLVFSRSRSLSLNPGTAADTVALIKTGKYAWGETDLQGEREEVEWNEGEVRGPVTLAVAAVIPRERGDERPPTRLFIAGDSSFASNQLLALSSNKNLLLNSVGWLTSQEDKIAIRPRTRGANLIVLSPQQREAIAFFVLYLLPVLLLSLGLGIWLVRRQR
jgi:ABC-type uncharacterized transport system involved in gliding motility auxiliary subunit